MVILETASISIGGIMKKYSIFIAVVAMVCSLQAVNLKWIPQDTKFLLEIDVKAFNESETGKYFKETAAPNTPGTELVRNFAGQTGIDIAKDVTSVVVCGNGTPGAEGVCVMLNGTWDVAKVAAALPQTKNFNTKDFGKHVIMNWEDNGSRYACLVNNNLAILAANETRMQLALDTFDGQKPNVANDAAFADFNPVAKKPFVIVRVNRINELAKDNQRAAMMQQTDSLSLLVESLPGTTAIGLDIAVVALSAEVAQQMTTMIQGMQAMAQMQGANNPDFLDITKAFTISNAGNKVNIKGKLSRELVKKTLDNVAKMGTAGGAQAWPIPGIPPAFE